MSRGTKIFSWILVGAVLVIGLPIAAFFANDAHVNWKRNNYYRDHPLQKAMLASATRADGAIVTTSPGPKQVLLDYLPLGTLEQDIFTKLRAAGFECEYAGGKRELPLILCYVPQERQMTYNLMRWHLELKINESSQLSDARVLMLK